VYEFEYLPDDVFEDAQWQKSTRSDPQPNCVELAEVDGVIGVRDSKVPGRAILQFDKSEIAAFLAAVKDGEFDHLAA
jgi:hypothetical protein